MPVQTRSMTSHISTATENNEWDSDDEETKVYPITIIKRELGYTKKYGEHRYCIQVGHTIEWLPRSKLDEAMADDFDRLWLHKTKTVFDKKLKCHVCIL